MNQTQTKPALAAGARTLTTSKPQPAIDPARVEQLTREVAYGIWQKNGCCHGNDVADWIEAERIVRKQLGIA